MLQCDVAAIHPPPLLIFSFSDLLIHSFPISYICARICFVLGGEIVCSVFESNKHLGIYFRVPSSEEIFLIVTFGDPGTHDLLSSFNFSPSIRASRIEIRFAPVSSSLRTSCIEIRFIEHHRLFTGKKKNRTSVLLISK